MLPFELKRLRSIELQRASRSSLLPMRAFAQLNMKPNDEFTLSLTVTVFSGWGASGDRNAAPREPAVSFFDIDSALGSNEKMTDEGFALDAPE